MGTRRAFLRDVALATLAALLPLRSAARETPIDVGGARIALPWPPGLVPLTNRFSPTYKLAAANQASSSSTLLAYFDEPQQARIADDGKIRAQSSDEWAFVHAPDKLLAHASTAKEFEAHKRVAASAMKRSVAKDFDALQVGVLSPLGRYGAGKRHISFGYATAARVGPPGQMRTAPAVMYLSYVYVRERILTCALHRVVPERSGIEGVKAAGKEWVDAIIAANP